MDILKLLKPLSEFENNIGVLYKIFSESFADDKAASSLFFLMSIQEESHRDIIEYQRRVIFANRDHFQEVDADPDIINDRLKEIEGMTVNARARRVKIEDAVSFALRMEEDACEYYFKSLVAQSNPTFSKLVSKLGDGCAEHKDKLRELGESLKAEPIVKAG